MSEDVHPELQSHLSALMDGEVGEFELRRTLSLIERDPALRAKWRRYHLAAGALRGEAGDRSADLSARIADALADAPAPRPRILTGILGRTAVAASVAVLTIAGARYWLPFEGADPGLAARTGDEQTQQASRPMAQPFLGAPVPGVQVVSATDGTAVPVGAPDAAPRGLSPAEEEQIRRYVEERMLRHAESAAVNHEGLLPFARVPRRVEQP